MGVVNSDLAEAVHTDTDHAKVFSTREEVSSFQFARIGYLTYDWYPEFGEAKSHHLGLPLSIEMKGGC